MSESPPVPGPEPDAPSLPGANLETYFRANQDRLTRDVLTDHARAADHGDEAIRAAWGAVDRDPQPTSNAGTAVRRIAIAYGVTWLILSLGMLLNQRGSTGEFMPTPTGGIGVLGVSLVVVFLASLVWVASRRAFWTILAVFSVLSSLSTIAYNPGSAIVVIVVAGALLLFLWRPGSKDPGSSAEVGVLLAMPLLLLLVVGGTCLASGLPVPGGG